VVGRPLALTVDEMTAATSELELRWRVTSRIPNTTWRAWTTQQHIQSDGLIH